MELKSAAVFVDHNSVLQTSFEQHAAQVAECMSLWLQTQRYEWLSCSMSFCLWKKMVVSCNCFRNVAKPMPQTIRWSSMGQIIPKAQDSFWNLTRIFGFGSSYWEIRWLALGIRISLVHLSSGVDLGNIARHACSSFSPAPLVGDFSYPEQVVRFQISTIDRKEKRIEENRV